MTTITIDSALLEQALESMCWAARTLDIDPDEAQNYHRSLENLRTALSAPATAPEPSWQDAPTEPGIWLCDEGGPDCYTYTAHNIVLLNDPALKDDECRWYGPIPQGGAKAEGGAA